MMRNFHTTALSYRGRALAGAAALAMLGGAGAAYAQEPAPAPQTQPAITPAADAQADSGEIVVTAQLREQRLQDVPISVNVVSGETLTNNAIIDTKALSQASPSLTLTYGASAGQSAVALRGIASVQQGSGGIQPSVSLVVDGVPIQRQGEFSADLLQDVERVEVLGGPQGTLFGKNSTAGVISITTRRPTREFEGWVRAGITDDKEYEASALVNAPLGQKVQARVMGFYRDQNPITKNYGLGNDITGARSYGANAKVNFDLTDASTLLLFGGFNRYRGSYNENISVNAPPNIAAQQIAALGYTPHRGQNFINSNNPTRELLNTWNLGAQFDLQLSDTLKWVTIGSYRHYKNDNTLDSDDTNYGVVAGSGFAPGSVGYPFLFVDVGLPRRPDLQKYWSVESRLHFDNDVAQAVLGAFYQDFKEDFVGSTPFLLGGPVRPTGATCPATAGFYCYSNSVATNSLSDRTASLFADLTVSLSDTFKIFGGARYTYEKLEDTYSRRTFLNPADGFFNPLTGVNSAPPTVTIPPTLGVDKVNNLSGRVGVQYQPSRNSNFYFSFAHGYKGPGADFGNGVANPTQLLVAAESANSFELGTKQQLFGGKLAIDLALYHLQINNLQVSAPVPGLSVPQTQLLNVAGLVTKGVEGTARWRVTRGFSLDGGLSYNDATLRQFAFGCYLGQTAATGCLANQVINGKPVPGSSQNLGGKRAPGGPKWKATANANLKGEFGSSEVGYSINVNYVHQTSIQYGINQDPFTIEPGHDFLNASVDFISPDKRWDLLLYAKNITNEFYYSSLTTANSLAQPIGRLPRDYERYFGARVTYKF